MATTILGVDVHDVRFPTAAAGDGSDAINRGDYSATYVELRTDAGDRPGPASPSPTAAATRSPARPSGRCPTTWSGVPSRTSFADPVAFSRSLTADVQLRWLGPEKGVIAHGDRRAGQRGLGPAGPAGRQAAVAAAGRAAAPRSWSPASTSTTSATRSPRPRRCDLLDKAAAGYEDRLALLERDGFPSYTTSVGWLGYPDEKVRALTRAAVAQGWTRGEDEGRRPDRRRRAAGRGSSATRSGRTRCS